MMLFMPLLLHITLLSAPEASPARPFAPARAHGCLTSACLFAFRRMLGKRIRWSRRVWRQHVLRIREGHMTVCCSGSQSLLSGGKLIFSFVLFFSITRFCGSIFSAVESKSARAGNDLSNVRCALAWRCSVQLCTCKRGKTDVFLIPQVDLMRNISGIPQPFLYTRHVHFLNFTR